MTKNVPSHGLRADCKFVIIFLICVQCAFCWMARARSLSGDVDLRAFYAAGSIVHDGQARDLYNFETETRKQHILLSDEGKTLPFLYPAFAALPFVPLSVLPYKAAFLLLLLGNLCCLGACAFLLVHNTPPGALTRWWLFALFLSFFPTAIALMQGQISCVLLLIFVSFHVLTQRGKMFLGGLCLSLALVKFQLVLPIVLLYLLGRQFRVLYGFLSGGCMLISLSLFLVGTEGAKAYLACLHGVSTSMLRDPAAAQAGFGMQVATEPNLHGLVTMLAGSGPVGIGVTLACSLAVIVYASHGRTTMESALPAAMLVSYHMQPYDLILLLLPLSLWLLSAATPRSRHPTLAAGLFTSIALLTAPLAPMLLIAGETAWYSLAVAGTFLACAGPSAAKGTTSFTTRTSPRLPSKQAT